MAREVGQGKIATHLIKLKNKFKGKEDEPGVEVFIQEINHAAGWGFIPNPYAGDITVFRPQKNYDFFPDPNMGWSALVGGRLEIVELPVNPHAMLIQPCVTRLAAELTIRIQQFAPKA